MFETFWEGENVRREQKGGKYESCCPSVSGWIFECFQCLMERFAAFVEMAGGGYIKRIVVTVSVLLARAELEVGFGWEKGAAGGWFRGG